MGLSVAGRPRTVYSLGDAELRTPALMARGTRLPRVDSVRSPARGSRLAKGRGSRTRVAPSRHARKAVLSYLFSGVEALERTPQPSPACAETEDAIQAHARTAGPLRRASRNQRPLTGATRLFPQLGSRRRLCCIERQDLYPPRADASPVLLTMWRRLTFTRTPRPAAVVHLVSSA